MIPSTVGFLDKDFEIEEQPSVLSVLYIAKLTCLYGTKFRIE